VAIKSEALFGAAYTHAFTIDRKEAYPGWREMLDYESRGGGTGFNYHEKRYLFRGLVKGGGTLRSKDQRFTGRTEGIKNRGQRALKARRGEDRWWNIGKGGEGRLDLWKLIGGLREGGNRKVIELHSLQLFGVMSKRPTEGGNMGVS